jgi:hypothetical protein
MMNGRTEAIGVVVSSAALAGEVANETECTVMFAGSLFD